MNTFRFEAPAGAVVAVVEVRQKPGEKAETTEIVIRSAVGEGPGLSIGGPDDAKQLAAALLNAIDKLEAYREIVLGVKALKNGEGPYGRRP